MILSFRKIYDIVSTIKNKFWLVADALSKIYHLTSGEVPLEVLNKFSISPEF